MAGELIAQVAVEAEEVEEVVALEDGMLLDHPVQLVAHERFDDRRGDVGVVVRPERVADVVDEGAGDVVVVAVRPVGACRRLQRVRQAIDAEAAEVTVEQAQVGDDAIAEVGVELQRRGDDVPPVLLGALGHRREGGAVGSRRVGGHWCAHRRQATQAGLRGQDRNVRRTAARGCPLEVLQCHP